MASERQEAEALDEIAAPPPDQKPDGNELFRHESLESERRRENLKIRPKRRHRLHAPLNRGTLARLGIVALTTYPGAPNAHPILWANVGGSLFIGFLQEDRLLFRRHWKRALHGAQKQAQEKVGRSDGSEEGRTEDEVRDIQEQAQQLFGASKVTLHIYIGVAVGFCGSFTSFADVIRDAFLAVSNDFDTARISTLVTENIAKTRPAGYSVLAVIGIVWLQVAMSTAALQLGAHIATGVQRFTERLPEFEYEFEEVMDKMVVVLGWGAWLGAVMLAVWPPYEAWRGQAVFAIVFAPLGCLLRFYLALFLNRRAKSFPVGTFVANVFGTCVLRMVLDLQQSRLGGVIGCQILQGVGDGFCGALTTVSTFILELKALRLVHSYVYATASVGVSFAFMVAIMGSLRWTGGFLGPLCVA
ncbi:hypothetical protein LTR74_016030 [Friedmanniomyces endolithicus]|nr:hypothetical protein LTR74_016030 [Friedmanniomyces endolithicus]